MAKIVYGVSGEGSGHSSRAREMIGHLESKGHTVRAASYDRGFKNLCDDFDILEISGLHIASVDNKVSPLKTLTQNIAAIPQGKTSLKAVKETLFREFKPDCVITDFEPMTAYLANHYKIPLISLDNQHRMRYMEYPSPMEHKKDALITEAVIRAMIPKPCVSLITTFYYGKLKNSRSFLFPPILRQSVLNVTPSHGDHILIYLSAGFDSLLDYLKTFSRERFLVYGYNRDEENGSLQFKPFSKDGFLEDLTSAKAVIATAGFTLMSECFHLGKPYLALPMKGQFEQVLNGIMLDMLGYGKSLDGINRESMASFLYDIPGYADRLESYKRQGNRLITQKLDKLLVDDCSLLKEFHKNRS